MKEISQRIPVKSIVNFCLFQLGWFLCVIVQNRYYLPVIFTMAAIYIHHRFIVDDGREWIGVVLIVLTGISVDSIFNIIGVLEFFETSTIPIWLVCIWVLFSMTLCHGLSWLQERYIVAGLLSAFAGPLSYIAGSRLSGGTVHLGDPVWLSVMFLSLFWAFMVPFALFLMKKLFVKTLVVKKVPN